MTPNLLRDHSALEGWLECGLTLADERSGQTCTGVPAPPRVRVLKPLAIPRAPSHRKRVRVLAWLLIPLLAARSDIEPQDLPVPDASPRYAQCGFAV